MPKPLPQRPSTKTEGKPLPTKMRFLKNGVMIVVPTAMERAKIAMGFNIKVSVMQAMQHNPGKVEVSFRHDLTDQNDFKNAPQLTHLPVEPVVAKSPVAKEGGA